MQALKSYSLSKSYKNIRALDNVSFEVPEGSIYGFLGPNGSGKSTFIRILTGLIRSDKGHFEIFGKSSNTGYTVRRQTSALVERADFYTNLSAFGNLKILGRITGHDQTERIHELLNLMGLYHRRMDKVKTFSQGMKQRLGLAQALLTDPKLLILDEPTSGLDPIGMVDVRQFILKIAEERKVTVFLSSHLLHEVEEICSNFALIFNGRITIDGPIEQIFHSFEEVTLDIELDRRTSALKYLEASALAKEITELPNLVKVRVRSGDIPQFIRELAATDSRLYSISQKNRLEEFFMQHTKGRVS